MAIDFSNTSFQKFASFAESVSRGTRVTFETQAGGAPGNFTVKALNNWDFVGNVKRGAAKRLVNDQVRALFLDAVGSLFGGQENIPDHVKKAMEMHNFNKGKPLTARRIIAVKKAIEDIRNPLSYMSYPENLDSAVQELKTKVSPMNERFNAADVSKLVDAMIKEAGEDLDLLNFLAKCDVTSLLNAGGGQLRSEESVKKTVAALKANIEELRTASGADKSLFYMGLRCLSSKSGKPKPFNPGVISEIVSQVRKADISAFSKLSASSGFMQIHNGVSQYSMHVSDIMRNTKALESFGKTFGRDEIQNVRKFIGGLLIARCSESAQSSILAALQSNTSLKLQAHYAALQYDNRMEEDLGVNLAAACSRLAQDCSDDIYVISGLLHDNEEPLNQRLEEVKTVAPNLFNDVMRLAKNKVAADANAMIKDYVSGNGQGSDIVKEAFDSAIKGFGLYKDPMAMVKMRMSQIARNGLHDNIKNIAKSFADDEAAALADFDQGLRRILNNGSITIGGVTLDSKVKVDDAVDQIAKFVAKKSFSSLNDQEKNKVFVVMSLITQGTVQMLSKDVFKALDARPGVGMADLDTPFTVVDDGIGQSKLTMTIDMDERGDLSVEAKLVNNVSTVLKGSGAEPTEEDTHRPTLGRTITTDFNLKLPNSSLNNYGNMPKITDVKFDNKCTNDREVFCKVDCKVELN